MSIKTLIPRSSRRMLGIRCTGRIRSSVNVCRPHSGFPWHSCAHSVTIITYCQTFNCIRLEKFICQTITLHIIRMNSILKHTVNGKQYRKAKNWHQTNKKFSSAPYKSFRKVWQQRWRKYSGPCVMQVLRKFRSCSVHVAPLETAGIFNVEMIP